MPPPHFTELSVQERITRSIIILGTPDSQNVPVSHNAINIHCKQLLSKAKCYDPISCWHTMVKIHITKVWNFTVRDRIRLSSSWASTLPSEVQYKLNCCSPVSPLSLSWQGQPTRFPGPEQWHQTATHQTAPNVYWGDEELRSQLWITEKLI